MKKILLTLFIFRFLYSSLFAQLPPGSMLLPARIEGDDTIPMINLPPVDIIGVMSPEALKRYQNYSKLKKDVRIALPYAKLAAAKLNEIDANVSKYKTEKEKQAYIKAEEKILKEKFTNELTNLTINQGRILIKLIDRETGNTTYALVKELRGRFQAFFWQGIARIFGSNLKVEYDANKEDAAIEQIIKELEFEQSHK